MSNWKYININNSDVMIMSGWKIYVYGESILDAQVVEECIINLCKDYNITCKVATNGIIARNKALKPAWGIAVVYLHTELFNKQQVRDIIPALSDSLQQYNKAGNYEGSHAITNKLSIRYDFDIPVKCDVGLLYEDSLNHYRGERGEFNIPGNEIPNQLTI